MMGDTQFLDKLTLVTGRGGAKDQLVKPTIEVVGPLSPPVPIKKQIGDSLIGFLIIQSQDRSQKVTQRHANSQEVVISGYAIARPGARKWQATVGATDGNGGVITRGKARGIGFVMAVKRVDPPNDPSRAPNPPQIVTETWCHDLELVLPKPGAKK
jgi:hypothetical protein